LAPQVEQENEELLENQDDQEPKDQKVTLEQLDHLVPLVQVVTPKGQIQNKALSAALLSLGNPYQDPMESSTI